MITDGVDPPPSLTDRRLSNQVRGAHLFRAAWLMVEAAEQRVLAEPVGGARSCAVVRRRWTTCSDPHSGPESDILCDIAFSA